MVLAVIKPTHFIACLCVVALSATASAEDLVYDLTEAVNEDLIYASGDAVLRSDETGVFVELTPAEASVAGSIFSRASVDSASFETQFAFRIEDRGGGDNSGCNDAPGADGLAMVILPAPDGLGGDGGGMGYEGMGTLVSIEFDTFCNPHVNDLDSNHAAILIGGETQHSANNSFSVGVSPDFDLGDEWYAWVDYDGTYLSLRLDLSPEPSGAPLLFREMDIPAIVGGERAHIGFTAGTGSAWGRHLITEWIHFGDTEQERTPDPEEIEAATRAARGGGGRGGRGGHGIVTDGPVASDRNEELAARGLRQISETRGPADRPSRSVTEHGSAQRGAHDRNRIDPRGTERGSAGGSDSRGSGSRIGQNHPSQNEAVQETDRERGREERGGTNRSGRGEDRRHAEQAAEREEPEAAAEGGESAPAARKVMPAVVVVGIAATAWIIRRRRR